MNRKASWALALAVVLIFTIQQLKLTTALRNERRSDEQLSAALLEVQRAHLELAALRPLALKASSEPQPQPASWVAPLVRPLKSEGSGVWITNQNLNAGGGK